MGKSVEKAKEKARKLAQSNKLKKARSVLQSVATQASSDGDFWNLLGLICGMDGDNSAAEDAFKKAIMIVPDDAALRNNLGSVLKHLGKLDEAEMQYASSLRIQPGYVGATVNLGALHIANGDFRDAEALLSKAVVMQANNAEAWNNLGLAQRGLGRESEAINSFQHALSLTPDFLDALVNLGVSYQFSNHLDQAAGCFKKVIAAQSQHVEAIFNLGFVHNKSGRLVEAEAMFRRVLQIEPNHTNADYYLSIMGVEDAPAHSPAGYVKELFDMYAEKFDDHLVKGLEYKTPGLIDRLIRTYITQSNPGLDIMDLGCGTGLCGQLVHDLASSLIGVDLSPKMLDKARELSVYDELLEDDVVDSLLKRPKAFDLVISGDVFVYIGDLSDVIKACFIGLRENGLLVFSVEKTDDTETYLLRESGRYAQNPLYITELAFSSGFEIRTMEETVLRKENGKDIHGMVYVMVRP